MRINRRKTPPEATHSIPSFFKIIVPFNLIHHKLRIPKDFAKVYRKELSTTAKLTVPSGEIWHVGLEKGSNKSLWFHAGWKEFADHHSVGCWFLITFDYVMKTSTFNVHIYDLRCIEITYPRGNQRKQCIASDKWGKSQGDESVEKTYSSRSSVDVETSGERCNLKFLQNLSDFAPAFAPTFSETMNKLSLQCSYVEWLKSNTFCFTRSKLDDDHKKKKMKFDDQNKWDQMDENVEQPESRSMISCFITAAKDDLHQNDVSGSMELVATQSEDDDDVFVSRKKRQPGKSQGDEDKSSNEGVVFNPEYPISTVIMKPEPQVNFLFESLLAHISIEEKYLSFNIMEINEYFHITSKAMLLPLASGVKPWEVVLERDQPQINIQQLSVYEYDSPNLETEYPTESKTMYYLPSNISKSEGGDKSVEMSTIPSESRLSQGCTNLQSGKRCRDSFARNRSEFAPEFSHRMNKHGTHFSSSSTEKLRSESHSYFTRSKRRKLDHERKISANEVCEMPNPKRSSIIDKPDQNIREPTKNADNSHPAEDDGPNQTETWKEDEELPTIKHDELFLSRKERKPGKSQEDEDKLSDEGVVVKPYPHVNMLFESFRDHISIEARYLSCYTMEINEYLHITSKATAPVASGVKQGEVVVEKAQPQINIQQLNVHECDSANLETEYTMDSQKLYYLLSDISGSEGDKSVGMWLRRSTISSRSRLMHGCTKTSQILSEFAPEFSHRMIQHGTHFSSPTEKPRSERHYYLTRSKRRKLDNERKISAGEVCEMPNSERSSILDKPDQNKREPTKNAGNSDSAKDDDPNQTWKEDNKEPRRMNEEVDLPVPKKSTKKSEKSAGRNKAIREAMMYKAEYPAFTAIMKPRQVRHCFLMYVPVEFSRKHLHFTKKTRIHLVFGGKEWEVVVVVNPIGYYLSGGWSTFARDNGLMVGDVCVFELVQVKNTVLKVSVFRANEGSEKTNLQK